MNDEPMLKPALIGGVLLGVLSALPVVSAANCLCCAWVIGGGILAAHLYVRASALPVTLGRGVLLGLCAGAIGAVADTILSIPLHYALAGIGMDFARSMEQALDQIPNLPAETRDLMRSIFGGDGTISVAFIILAGFFKLILYGVMAMLGGAIGVAIFEKRKPGGPAPGMTTYPHPGGPSGGYQPPPGFPPPPPPPGV